MQSCLLQYGNDSSKVRNILYLRNGPAYASVLKNIGGDNMDIGGDRITQFHVGHIESKLLFSERIQTSVPQEK